MLFIKEVRLGCLFLIILLDLKKPELFKVIGSIREVSDAGGFLAAKQRTCSAFQRVVDSLQQLLTWCASVRSELVNTLTSKHTG